MPAASYSRSACESYRHVTDQKTVSSTSTTVNSALEGKVKRSCRQGGPAMMDEGEPQTW
jgi:hypothetical protein